MKAIIVGGGKIGFYLAKALSERDYSVTMIEQDREQSRYCANNLEAEIICGNGTTVEALEAAGADKADCVIAIDALSCQDPRFIGKTVQISSSGLIPGSGAGGRGSELSEELLGCPTVAVGVPTVTQLSSITQRSADRRFLVSVPDIDIIIGMWAEVIGGALDLLVGEKGMKNV